MTKKAIVAGATGLVGAALLDKLLADPYYSEVYILVRRTTGRQNDKLTEWIVDFDRLALDASTLQGADVFCTLGTTIKKAGSQEQFRKVDCEYPVELARQAASSGADQFLIVTAMGSDTKSMFFYSRVKGETEALLRQLAIPGLSIFQPSLLTGEREEVRRGERLGEAAARRLSFVFTGPFRKYKPIAAATVAEGMIRAARLNRPGIKIYESDAISDLVSH
ncbi:SDR family oxidoreductase [Paenibacillus sp. UNC451MF]|uniref:SDR family oxidoreductase n=1 Tax=Paenibacillus sp. UNC451MF TaxID=1449063 RepID=UPI00048BE842|nr:NAD(P)H-binding protein [Paenibacillus sp. UNC451MF]